MADNPFAAEQTKRGAIRSELASNPFAVEQARRTVKQEITIPEQPESSALGAFGESAFKRFANNALGAPRAISSAGGDLLAALGAGTEALAAPLAGKPMDFMRRFQEQKEVGPAKLLRSFPAPTVQDISAALTVPFGPLQGRSFSEQFDKQREYIAQTEASTKEAHPIAVPVGEVAGDVATLIAGRAPFAKSINRAETNLLTKLPKQLTNPGTQFIVNKTIASPAMRALARGAGRSLEAGLEAAALEIIKGDDPTQAALFAAGSQAGGSMALTAMKGLVSGGPGKAAVKIAATAFATGSVIQLLKDTTPGGRDRILESIETGHEKVLLAIALGVAAGAVGSGRLRGGKFAELYPKFADALATVPRGAMLSVLTQWAGGDSDKRAQIEAALGRGELPRENRGATGRW